MNIAACSATSSLRLRPASSPTQEAKAFDSACRPKWSKLHWTAACDDNDAATAYRQPSKPRASS
eukprot:5809417-Prymnesium_polylepis.1